MEDAKPSSSMAHRLHDDELKLLQKLRLRRREPGLNTPETTYSVGDQIADKVAATVGSWKFIIIQSFVLVAWMFLNVTAYIEHWDPYPFILLNLVLSFQAAYAAPFIMMSQNRQACIDRADAKGDYDVNVKAELEIELLHQKLDQLREAEIGHLVTLLETLTNRLAGITETLAAKS